HAVNKANAVAMGLLNALPVIERLAQTLRIDFDPLAAQENQPLRSIYQLLPFFLAERLTVERQSHMEIKQCGQTEGAGGPLADFDPYLRARRPPRRPPVGHPNHNDRLLHLPRLRQKPVRLPDGPGLCAKRSE